MIIGKMKKLLTVNLLFLIVTPLFALTNLKIGALVPEDAIKVDKHLILASPSQFQNLYKWTSENTNYLLGVDEDKYIQFICLDSFEKCTEENVIIGDAFSKIKKIKGIKITYWFEWGYCVELPSGWILKFDNNEYYNYYKDGLTSSQNPFNCISEDATVNMIFKGTGAGYGSRID